MAAGGSAWGRFVVAAALLASCADGRPTTIAILAACTGDKPSTTPTPSGPLTLELVEALPDDDPANAVAIRAVADRPVAAEVWCTLDADPDEVHHAVVEGVSASPAVTVYGLLADADYTCELVATDPDTAEEVVGEAVVTTLSGPEELPELVASWPAGDPSRSAGGYTLFNHWKQDGDPKVQKLVMVDPEGRVRWSYILDLNVSVGVEVNSPEPGLILAAGGRGYNPTFLSYGNEILYRSPDPISGGVYHHHASLLDSGDILSLASADNTDGDVVWEGFVVELRQAWTGLLKWSWDSQQAVDAGILPAGSEDEDTYHANAAQYVEDADGAAIYVSLRQLDQILRLDLESGEVSWILGPGGDFALLGEDGAPLDDELWYYGQHDPEYRLPRVFVHDNGYGRPGDDYTRAIELSVDVTARTATLVWEHLEDGWVEPVWGDVDLLPATDTVLISQGHCYDCGGGDPDRLTAIIELDPRTDDVVWRLDFLDERAAVYRADHVDGCDAFANARYCPAVAARARARRP